MSFIKNLKKISPEVAELYEEIYEDCISEVLSQSFHDVFIEFGICPYQTDAVYYLHLELEKWIVTKLCNDERFLNLPVKKAYFHDAEDEEQYLYIIKNKKCCGCGKSHYFAVVDTGKHFQLETLTELPVSIKTVVAPSTIREVIEKYF